MDTPPSDPQNPPSEGPVTPSGPPPNPPTPVAPPEPPPAATIVREGTKTEREMALEKDLQAREQRLAELEDENRKLKTPPTPPTPPARTDKAKRRWLKGGTFFEDED
jgi:hypothetical protein